MPLKGRQSAGRRLYVASVISSGVVIVAQSLYTMSMERVPLQWFVLAGLTLLSGSFTVRVPTISARLSVSETFVFAAALLFGPAAATIIVLLDTLVISLWQGQRATTTPERVLFNASAPSIAIWSASHIFYWISDIDPLSVAPQPILSLVPALLVLAAIYFLLNTWLIAWAVAFQKHLPAFRVWRQNFSWLFLNYFSGASVAALLLPLLNTTNQSEFARIIGILLPILLVSYLTLRTALGRVDDANRHLTELNKLYISTIETLAMAIDAKDQITHGHIRRVQSYTVGLARAMGVTDDGLIKAVEAAALLHDMGKLAVPEYILNKPGPLTAAEFEKMKLHASVGADILSSIAFPYPVVPIVRHHHESWNGTGYPDGLKGTDIPIGARILSVVDCFDALTSDRPYRPRLTDKEALRILVDRRGTMYDPLVVDTFIRIHSELRPTIEVRSSPSFAAISGTMTAGTPQSARRLESLEGIASSSDEMLTLFTLAKELTGRMTIGDVGEVLLKHLRRLVPCSLCVFYLYDDATGDLTASHVSGESGETIHGLRIPLGERLSGWVAANRRTIRNSNPVLDFGDSARAMTPRVRSCLSTPLIERDVLVGVLSLYATTIDGFTEDHQRLIEAVARQVSPVLQDSVQQSRASSPIPLPDATERSKVLEHTRDAAAEATANAVPSPSALIYLNIKSTSDLNSERQLSEHLLKEISRRLRETLRSGDTLFRLGSDEFAVLLRRTDRELASAILGRMRASLQEIRTAHSGGVLATSAFVVVTAPEDGSRIDSLVEAARLAVVQRKGTSSSSSESVH